MKTSKQKLYQLIELANLYPSPHNGQPIKMKLIKDNEFYLEFDKSRGLQSQEISLLFSFVSMGVFVQHLIFCAEALGHDVSYKLNLPNDKELKGNGVIKFGKCKIDINTKEPNDKLLKSITTRQTSRKKYYKGLDNDTSKLILDSAKANRMILKKLNKNQSKKAIWLNQRAVFDDMFNNPVREELDHWLRYTQKEKNEKKDGLAYDCMELNGKLMKFIVQRPKFIRWPIISQIIKMYYLRTMSDNSDCYYMMAPFRNENDSFRVGLEVMNIWQILSSKGYYLHPFGTIMSSH